VTAIGRLKRFCNQLKRVEETIKMMADWNGYRQQLVETIGKIARLSPETVKGYSALSAAGAKTNHLGAKTREPIALAVAVTLRCDIASRFIPRRQ
jgi:alkylhydroperoxidase/carboxymuconolactone decarboxylase family protein YurZ